MHSVLEKRVKAVIIGGMLFCCVCMVFLSCQKNGTEPMPVKNPALSDLMPDLAGWAAPSDTGTKWLGPNSMFDFVNGGDWSYIQDSVRIDGIQVTTLDTGLFLSLNRASSADSDYAQLFVLDYRTPANAAKVFNRLIEVHARPSNKIAIGRFDTLVAIGGVSGSSLWSYAHFGRFYVEFRTYIFVDGSTLTNDSLVAITNICFTQLQSRIE
jgi:hypothetical protein